MLLYQELTSIFVVIKLGNYEIIKKIALKKGLLENSLIMMRYVNFT